MSKLPNHSSGFQCFIRVQKVEGAARDLLYSDKTRASSLLNIFKNNTYNTIGQPRSQGFSLFVIGKAGKGPGTGRSHDFQHPDIVGVINYN